MKQETFTDIEYGCRRKKTKREEFLEIMDEIIPWDEWVGVIEPYYSKGKRGRPPMGIEKMLRTYPLQIWFNLSDPGTEDEPSALSALDAFDETWGKKYPRAMKRWYDNWDAISPIFKFSRDVRAVIYTTNAIESLNSTYRRLNSQRSVFPSDTALFKALYLATFEATKKWTMPIRNWGKVCGELAIMYDGRLPD